MGKIIETKFYKGTRIVHVRTIGEINEPEIAYVDEVADAPTTEQLQKLKERRLRRGDVRFYTK